MLADFVYLLQATADTIHCIPIISRVTANTKFNIAIPNSGVEKTITDMATANTPTPNLIIFLVYCKFFRSLTVFLMCDNIHFQLFNVDNRNNHCDDISFFVRQLVVMS